MFEEGFFWFEEGFFLFEEGFCSAVLEKVVKQKEWKGTNHHKKNIKEASSYQEEYVNKTVLLQYSITTSNLP